MNIRAPLLCFFGLSLAISWAGWLPYALSQAGRLSWPVAAEWIWLAEFGPSLAGVLMTAAVAGRGGLIQLGRQLCRWRVPLRWYLFALGLTPALVVLAALSQNTALALGDLAGWDGRFIERTRAFQPSLGLISGLVQFMETGPWATALVLAMLALTNGGLSEELGWRGFALNELQRRGRGPLLSSVVIGLMWAGWHTGTAFWQAVFTQSPRQAIQFAAAYLGEYSLLVVPLAVLYTALLRGSRGSLLLAILFHGSYNATITIVASTWASFPMLALLGWLWLLAIIVAGVWIRQGRNAAASSAP